MRKSLSFSSLGFLIPWEEGQAGSQRPWKEFVGGGPGYVWRQPARVDTGSALRVV